MAYVIDIGFVCGLMLPLCGFAEATGSDMVWGAWFATLVFAYQVYFLSQRAGATPGKVIRGICVVSAVNGRPLRFQQSVVRALFTALPFVCLAAGTIEVDFVARGLVAMIPVVGVAHLFSELLILEYTVAKNTVADRAARTVVVKLPPVEPHRAPAIPMFSVGDAEFGNPPKRPRHPSKRFAGNQAARPKQPNDQFGLARAGDCQWRLTGSSLP